MSLDREREADRRWSGVSAADELLARATIPDFVYTHRWRVGDLLLWDWRRDTLRRYAGHSIAAYALAFSREAVDRVAERVIRLTPAN